jgi:HK97 family phage major capsid protein
MAAATAEPTVLDGLKDRRAEISTEWDTLIEDRETQRAEFEARLAAEKDEEKPSDEERDAYKLAEEEFRTASADFERQFGEFDERIKLLQGKAERRKVAAEHSPDVEVVTEPQVYRRDNAHEFSYWKDLVGTNRELRAQAQLPNGETWTQADERLKRHGKQMDEIAPAKEARAQREAEAQIEEAEGEFRGSLGLERRALEVNPFQRHGIEQRVAPSRAPGAGGEMSPPLWLVEDDYIKYLRAKRVIAPKLRNIPMPPGTDVVKVPRIKLGTEVAPQLQDNAGVASRDIETESIEAPFKTVAGQEDVALQLIEQSPGQVFEKVVQEDLLAAFDLVVEENVSFGTGANYTTLNAGTIRGLFPGTNWGAEHRESTSTLTPQVLLAAQGANWSAISRKRFDTSNVHHFINPSVAAYLAYASDTEAEKGRQLLNASDFQNFNISGELAGETESEGFFARTPLGPNIYHTTNIPVKANKAATELTGTSYSYCATVKTDDCWFFESDLRARVLPEVVSGTLQIRYQVYAYIGMLVRYGASLQFAGGKAFEAAGLTLGGYTF